MYIDQPARGSDRRRGEALRARYRALVTVVVTVAASGATTSLAGASPDPTTVPGPALEWAACEGGFECATLDVPLDYRDPDGEAISLAAIRQQVADPEQRVGVLYLQPGGPGGSGVDFVRNNYADLPDELTQRFDVVSLDLRGVARSSSFECWNDARYTQAVTEAQGKPGRDAFDDTVDEAADFVAACEREAGDLVPYLGTGYVARDIDRFREALGEEELTYYGRSFGTLIGTVYANMFPDRVRAMTLDGAYDPERYANKPYAHDRAQFLALDGAVERLLEWCDDEPELCPFGNGDAEAAFDQLITDLDDNPVTLPSGGQANGYTVIYRLMFNINGGQADWPALGEALHQAQQRDPASFLLRPPSPASFDFLTPNVVVECIDRVYPRSLRLLEKRLTMHTSAAPLLGPAMGYSPPTYDHNHAPACVQWDTERPSRFAGPFNAAGSAPILVVGTTGDPDTPYRDAVALSRILDDASLLTFKAEGHTAFERSLCATEAITGYLADLDLPPTGTVCADEPAPSATSTTQRLGLIDNPAS